ncbi:hypothetical protein V8E53_013241 [Lactarius tabidus]
MRTLPSVRCTLHTLAFARRGSHAWAAHTPGMGHYPSFAPGMREVVGGPAEGGWGAVARMPLSKGLATMGEGWGGACQVEGVNEGEEEGTKATPTYVKGAGWATPAARNPEQVSGWCASEARPVQPGEGGWGRFGATLTGEGVQGRKQRNRGGWGRVHGVTRNPGGEGEGERSNTQPRRAKARVCGVHRTDGSVRIAHAAYRLRHKNLYFD